MLNGREVVVVVLESSTRVEVKAILVLDLVAAAGVDKVCTNSKINFVFITLNHRIHTHKQSLGGGSHRHASWRIMFRLVVTCYSSKISKLPRNTEILTVLHAYT